MKKTLLLIDPQNDFCDIDERCALPVPGANADLYRVADFIWQARELLDEIVVTLDSHPTVAIERPTFWRQADGSEVAPFTQIKEADVRAGRYLPRDSDPFLRERVLKYLSELEVRGRYSLMVWPVHCVVGSWGHNIHEGIYEQLAGWERRVQRGAVKIMKGLSPLTEQYSAVRAEVPRGDDPSTTDNQLLLESVLVPGGRLIVAGQAASHCVAATMRDLFAMMPKQDIKNVILLTDGMSSVSGFERETQAFFAEARTLGAQTLTCQEAAQRLL